MDLSGDLHNKPMEKSPEKKPVAAAPMGDDDFLGLGSGGPAPFSQAEPNRFEEDLMREFDQKASELSTFLDESHPVSANVDFLNSSASEKSSNDSSPNPPNLRTQAEFMESLGSGIGITGMTGATGDYDLIGDFKTGEGVAGGDTKITEELMSAARDFGKDSPTAMDLGFEQVEKSSHQQNSKEGLMKHEEDQIVPPPPTTTQLDELDHLNHQFGQDVGFHYTQSEPVMNFQKEDRFMEEERTESPKLPNEPCLAPHSPGMKVSQHDDDDDMFSIERGSKSAPEVVSPPKPPSHHTSEERFIAGHRDEYAREEPHFEDYTRRETMTFDNEPSLVEETEHVGVTTSSSFDSEREVPPPIPKHSYDIEQEIPPPVPKHANESIFQKDPPYLHATYDDKIDDEFEDDSLSRPLSHKLSDSLEVLKESPQKELQLDESLMDLDELPSSEKSNSPNGMKHLIGDFGESQVMGQNFPPEMVESGLFSQVPPSNLSELPEVEERIEISSIRDVEQSKPMASITPFSSKGNQDYDADALLMDTSMTGSMIMNTSLDEIQAPKFYESEDSSSKDVVPEEVEANKDQKSADKGEKKELYHEDIFQDFIPNKGKGDSDVLISSSDSSSKIDVVEVKPIPQKTEVSPKKEEEKSLPKPVVTQPAKQKFEVDMENDFEVSEEIQQILNIVNPRAWFDPAKLHPTVSELVYWRDPKKSGAAFGAVFIVLLACSLLSLISVFAYTSLAVLTGTFGFRIYKAVLQAVQKTNDGHPFKEFLELDVTFSGEKAQELSNAIINYANVAVVQLRRLFLVEDFVDSAKFGAFLYFLTYIGGWFNGLTLIILSFIALFSLPKVYETNKTVIDQYIDLVWGKISEINAKVTAAVPFLKKEKAQ